MWWCLVFSELIRCGDVLFSLSSLGVVVSCISKKGQLLLHLKKASATKFIQK